MLPVDNTVNVISLPHRNDRMQHFQQQAMKQGFTYRVWEGVIDKTPFTGIARAYKNVIRYAKENKLEYIIVAEDDICFSSPGAFDYFISKIPTEFDLFLASVYWSLEDIAITDTITDFSGLTLTVFHSRFYDTFLQTSEGNNIDRQMKVNNGLYKVCKPFCAYQIDGYSDNVGKETKYNDTYLKGVKFYTSTLPAP